NATLRTGKSIQNAPNVAFAAGVAAARRRGSGGSAPVRRQGWRRLVAPAAQAAQRRPPTRQVRIEPPSYSGPMARWSPLEWPVVRQLRSGDALGRGTAVTSPTTRNTTARTATADRMVQSICPYCAVGCGQRVYVKDEKVIGIEGDPDSPISRGRLCPKGAASEQLVNPPGRKTHVLSRAPGSSEWQRLDPEEALDMVTDRFLESRRRTWQDRDDEGNLLRRTMGIAALGGATLDNEENYLIKKLFTAAGAIQIENQAR